MKTARQIALEALNRIFFDNAYSNLAVDSALKKNRLNDLDASFVSALVYGVLERQITIDYQLSLCLKQPLKRLKPALINILRLGVYQLLFADKVPESAAINESVKLTKNNGCAYASALTNAVLRQIQKAGLRLPEESAPDHYSIKYSCPSDFFDAWREQYGEGNAIGIASSALGRPDIFVRVNTRKTDIGSLADKLASEGADVKNGPIPDSLSILDCGSVERMETFRSGLFHVQDIASQLCAAAVGAVPGDRILDLCSAPGGKAFTVAEAADDDCELICCDIHEHRLALIKGGAERLGLKSIKTMQNDASVANPDFNGFDKVLCDVPCSGLGIIRRKPDIKLKKFSEFDNLSDLQYNILSTASGYLKKGGRLIYSTCALNKNENEKVVARFLAANPDYKAADTGVSGFLQCLSANGCVTFLPHLSGTDGFFIAAFERRA